MFSPNDLFFKDLRVALTILTTTAVNTCCGYPSPFAMFIPPPIVQHSGCWCGVTRPHEYMSCPDAASKPRQTIILPVTPPGACYHTDEEKRDDRLHSLFCFNVAATTDLFMEWFVRQRIFRESLEDPMPFTPLLRLLPLPSAPMLDGLQFDAIMRIVEEFEEHCPKDQLCELTDLRFTVLWRLVTDLQKLEIPREARLTNHSWHVERVHAVLGWQWIGFDEALEMLTATMRTAMEMRRSPESVHSIIAREGLQWN